MARQIRKVPENWVHPSDGFYPDGSVRYTPLFNSALFAERAARWDQDSALWARGEYPDVEEKHKSLTFEEFEGPRPDPADYMPIWDEAECTHLMMYELSTEGTPVSPALESAEALALWMFENYNDVYAGVKLTLQEWRDVCNGHSQPMQTLFKKTAFD